MSDYIKRSDVKQMLCSFCREPECHSMCNVPIAVGLLPTANVVERKRGEWGCERVDFSVAVSPGAYVIRSPTCSVCGYHAAEMTNYCPNCGADMRKGGKS